MRFVLLCLTFAFVAQMKTTLDGIYTDAQAARGEAVYGKNCASCHGANFEGDGFAPPLADKVFADEWNEQPLSALFERIRTTMRGDAPGTLKPEEAADVLAFMLKKGTPPAGTSELPADSAVLKQLTYRKQQ